MKDNILKKEFNKKDVERLRNLVKGKGSKRSGPYQSFASTVQLTL